MKDEQNEMGQFPASWRAQVLRSAPLIAPARSFLFPQQIVGEEEALTRNALQVSVRPESGGDFLATCALGFEDKALPSGVWTCPRPQDLLAVAGGYAYRIDTLAPEETELLPLRPVAAVLPAVREGLLLLAGFHRVVALGPEGVRWQTERLSWEGVTLGTVQEGSLEGMGWDMFADREVPFRVDLRTGAHEGGGYRR